MSEVIEIEVDDIDKNDVDKNDVDKIFTFDDVDDKSHNGKPITIIETSPNENYLITYSEEDRSIVGWNVEDIDKVQLKFDKTVKIDEDNKYETESLCVSDDKKLCRIYNISDYHHDGNIDVIDMNNKDKIALSFYKRVESMYCTFNLKGEFILYSVVRTTFGNTKIIWIYSTQTKNNKWELKRFYEIPKDYELISISKYDKVYLFSNDYICEWNINTEKSVKIFVNNKDKNKFETKNIGIFNNDEKFIFLKVNDKIIVYSIELEIPIATLDINNDTQLYNFMNHSGLFLLPSLFYYTPDKEIKYCWNSKYKNILNQTLLEEPTDDEPTDEQTDKPTDEQAKFVFGILNERVWKSKFYENKVIECDDDDKITYKLSNVHLYMDTVSTLFQNAKCESGKKLITESIKNLIKWEIYAEDDKIKLEVFKKINTKWELISTRIEIYPYRSKYGEYHNLIVSSLFNNDIVILTTFGILVYNFSENNKSIHLIYFYFMGFDSHRYYSGIKNKAYLKILQHNERIFSKSTFPLPNYDSFRLNEWVSVVINNKLSLLKYGVELLTFTIKEHKLELIDDIYKKCMTYFKEDPMNNKSFLSIITSAMPLLDECYPEYILKYSLETNMIIDSSFYSIEHQNKNLHLYYSFHPPQITNLSKSILWTKYLHNIRCTLDNKNSLVFILLVIYDIIQVLIILLTLPLYLATIYILSKYNFINRIYMLDGFSYVYLIAVGGFKRFQKGL
ncbi:uncharacterized protein OCT59_016831 [Rhizophagus irregularis]|uniref:uncharacterized protein n=1 Tax=Rhizophagus irregularis TaxID=588596 RepID=UPI00332FA597|nr:hypothetical protein OCT59_016831 [Rhizophagus irregularis]